MNVIGSYPIVANLEQAYDERMSDELDEDRYAGSDAITLKIPFSLPYANFNENYERVKGKIEYEGEFYYMVKHKFYRDTLFIVCLKDSKLAEINYVYENLAASVADNHHSKTPGKSVCKLQVKDFEQSTTIQLRDGVYPLESFNLPEYSFTAIINSESPPEQPPKA